MRTLEDRAGKKKKNELEGFTIQVDCCKGDEQKQKLYSIMV